jgi:hypothetical protein
MVALLNEIRGNPAQDAETRIASLVKVITTAKTGIGVSLLAFARK